MAKRLALRDIYRVKSLSGLALAPDGASAAYVQSEYIEGADARTANLWVVSLSGGEPHRLTRMKSSDAAPRWSPDGRYLAFLSDRPKELELQSVEEWEKPADKADRPVSQIWVFDMRYGGEPRQLTDRPEGVDSFDWSPDGRAIVFAARDPSETEQEYLKGIRDQEKPKPIVINRVQHKADGKGYLDTVKTHLFIVDVPSREVRRLTEGSANEEQPVWSPDGQWILFHSNRTGDADNNRRIDLWVIRPDGQEAGRLTRGDVGAYSATFSPDGTEVVFVSSRAPENSYLLERLFVVSLADRVAVPALADAIGQGWSRIGGIVPDQVDGDPVHHARVYPVPTDKTPMRCLSESFDGTIGEVVAYLADGIMVLAHHRAQQKLVKFGLDGSWEILAPTERIGTLGDADINAAGMVVIYNRPEHAQEVYRLSTAGLQRLTSVNQWLDERTLGETHWVSYRNHDGIEVEAVVLCPPDFEPGRDRAPLLVNIHGGPMWYDTTQFEFDTQYWANRGYLVLMPNYRGSISYGETFCQSIQGDWGPREHDDVMCGVDHLLNLGWTREEALFCTGFSQGGIMTNWAVGHTDRFQAAVSEHGMWDYMSAFGTDDCHLWWQDDIGVPWQNRAVYERIAPMSGVASIHTPLLITAGEHDWRCPLNQAEELYLSLKKRGIPTELVIYQAEHHAISRPERAIDRLSRIDAWLAQYGGVPVKES